jgi:MoxR-like ATPase
MSGIRPVAGDEAGTLARDRDAVEQSRLGRELTPGRQQAEDSVGGRGVGIDPTVVADLARGEWILRGECIVLAGPIGTGKTHLAIALGIEAARRLSRIAFYRTADLVQALVEARDARELTRLQRRLRQVSLLICDELGFVPFDRSLNVSACVPLWAAVPRLQAGPARGACRRS